MLDHDEAEALADATDARVAALAPNEGLDFYPANDVASREIYEAFLEAKKTYTAATRRSKGRRETVTSKTISSQLCRIN